MPPYHHLRYIVAVTIALSAIFSLPAATTVIRGPYLQSATPTSMVVRWRTDNTEPSIVRYGLTRTELTTTVKAEGITTEHFVHLGNLKPNTRYYYTMGAEPVAKPAAVGTKKPAPPQPPPKPKTVPARHRRAHS